MVPVQRLILRFMLNLLYKTLKEKVLDICEDNKRRKFCNRYRHLSIKASLTVGIYIFIPLSRHLSYLSGFTTINTFVAWMSWQ